MPCNLELADAVYREIPRDEGIDAAADHDTFRPFSNMMLGAIFLDFDVPKSSPAVATFRIYRFAYLPRAIAREFTMQKLGWYLRRLQSMDSKEITWRIRRAAGDQLDVLRCAANAFPRLPDHRYISFDAFLPPFRITPNPLPSLLEPWKASLLDQAHEIAANRLSFFNLKQQFLGDPVDWHMDWSSGVRAPLKPCLFVDYRVQKSFGDCKLVWEPNRHHQLVVLARAFLATNASHYAAKLCDLLNQWLESNPYGRGMNWKSPLEIGIRLINWVWAIDLIRDNYTIEPKLWTKLQDAIYYSLWDLQRKFSKGSSANNHVIGEAAGAFIAGSYFPHLVPNNNLLPECRSILEAEILNQSYSDGCSREHAFGYQVFVLQFLSLSSIVAGKLGAPFNQPFHDRLRSMYEFLAEVSRDTGSPPSMGDADDGYVLDLGDKHDSVESLLSVGAHLFDAPSLQFGEPSETCAWLFGKSLWSGDQHKHTLDSLAFFESGYFLLRSPPSDVLRARTSILFDCAELGFGGLAAHGHADCLSFTLATGGTPVFVDPGTYDYFTFPEWRNYFRSTAAHNTVEIDGQSQSISSGPFMWSHRARPTLHDWCADEHFVSVVGSHTGYKRLDDPVIHTRSITLHATGDLIQINDDIACIGRHIAIRRFHLHPTFRAELLGPSAISVSNGAIRLVIEHDAMESEIVLADDDSREGWVSTGYHQKTKSSCIKLTDAVKGNMSLPLRILID